MGAIVVSMQDLRTGRALRERARADHVSRRFRTALKFVGLTQADICRLFDLNSSQVSQWASGVRRPKLDTLLLILPTLKVTLQYIYIGDDTGLDYDTRIQLARLERDEAEDDAAAAHDVKRRTHEM